jgi:hypothetical protein
MSGVRGLCCLVSTKLVAVLLAAVLTVGCQSVAMSYQKGIVPENKRIAIEDGNHTAKWSTNEVNLDYGYSKNQGSMRLYGEVYYADPIRYNYSLVQYFHMDVIFVDSQGRVLGTAGLVTDSSNPLAPSARTARVTFDRMLPVPPGTSSIAFSYTGAAREGNIREGGNPTNFWEYPIQ